MVALVRKHDLLAVSIRSNSPPVIKLMDGLELNALLATGDRAVTFQEPH